MTAQNVLFWLHMMLAVPGDWGLGAGFPQNVTDIRAACPATLTMTMKRAYSPAWFLYNELSQVTPMPTAWDRTARGQAACTAMVRDCACVHRYWMLRPGTSTPMCRRRSGRSWTGRGG